MTKLAINFCSAWSESSAFHRTVFPGIEKEKDAFHINTDQQRSSHQCNEYTLHWFRNIGQYHFSKNSSRENAELLEWVTPFSWWGKRASIIYISFWIFHALLVPTMHTRFSRVRDVTPRTRPFATSTPLRQQIYAKLSPQFCDLAC